MLLDGLEYAKGRLVTEEGVHRLRVRAEDAAGNDSVAEAVFTIDHTPPVLYMGRLKDGAIYEEKVKIEVWVDGEKRVSDRSHFKRRETEAEYRKQDVSV